MVETGRDTRRVPVFVSHAGPDTGWAEWVAWQLRSAGHEVELDVWHWGTGDDFFRRMRDALERPDVVIVALLSGSYFERSRWTQDEWSAIRVAARRGRGRLVPLRIEDVAVPLLDGPLIHRDLFGLDADAARRVVLEAVTGPHPPTQEPPFPGVVATGTSMRGGPRLPGVAPGVWRVPPRDRTFVGRDAMLAQLRESLRSGGPVVVQALQGIGGVGKTSLVVEYAHRFAADFDVVWWVDATQPGLIGEQLHALAVVLDLVAQGDVPAGISAVQVWLRKHGSWLVVFDNAEDPVAVRDSLPEGPGQVLLTSRDFRWEHIAELLPVDVFKRGESVRLLHRLLPKVTDAEATAVAEGLGDLPLGLAQAAGFMAESGIRSDEYLAELRVRAGELLREGTPATYPLSLAAAATVTLRRLADEDPAAVDLMQVCAFLAPEPVPLAWFTDAPAGVLQEPLALAAAVPVALRRTVARLARYGVVRLSSQGNPKLHRLTQAIYRTELDLEEAAKVSARVQRLLVAAHPGDPEDTATWLAYAALLPHVIAMLEYLTLVTPTRSGLPEFRSLAMDACSYLYTSNQYKQGVVLSSLANENWTRTLGEEHPDTLLAANRMAGAMTVMGRYEEARDVFVRVYQGRARVLGENHTSTLVAANNLAYTLIELGESKAARASLEQVVRQLTDQVGACHRETLRAEDNLGLALLRNGQYRDASKVLSEVYGLRRASLGDQNPLTLHTACLLGLALLRSGYADAGREILFHTWIRQRHLMGRADHESLRTAHYLSLALHVLGRRMTARWLLRRTLALQQSTLGEDHPASARTARDLAAFEVSVGHD